MQDTNTIVLREEIVPYFCVLVLLCFNCIGYSRIWVSKPFAISFTPVGIFGWSVLRGDRVHSSSTLSCFWLKSCVTNEVNKRTVTQFEQGMSLLCALTVGTAECLYVKANSTPAQYSAIQLKFHYVSPSNLDNAVQQWDLTVCNSEPNIQSIYSHIVIWAIVHDPVLKKHKWSTNIIEEVTVIKGSIIIPLLQVLVTTVSEVWMKRPIMRDSLTVVCPTHTKNRISVIGQCL